MPEQLSPPPLWRQLAARLADEIAGGTYAPGSLLPTEAELCERFGVSRITIRHAVAELRTLGLVEVRQGKGATVRSAQPLAPVVERSVTRHGYRFDTGSLRAVEPPTVTRAYLSDERAVLLGRDPDDEDAAFVVDRLLTDPDTELRAALQTVIPFDVAAGTALETAPETEPTGVYATLTRAGRRIAWQESVTARVAMPDDRATLGTEGVLLIAYRVAVDLMSDEEPLILETLRVPADAARLGYRIAATRPPRG
jgi:GntR family transcriptional regulator